MSNKFNSFTATETFLRDIANWADREDGNAAQAWNLSDKRMQPYLQGKMDAYRSVVALITEVYGVALDVEVTDE